jgi:hypothetical protein
MLNIWYQQLIHQSGQVSCSYGEYPRISDSSPEAIGLSTEILGAPDCTLMSFSWLFYELLISYMFLSKLGNSRGDPQEFVWSSSLLIAITVDARLQWD